MVFWAKCKDGFRRTVEEHLKDSAHVAKELYGDFLSDGLRKQLPLAICVFAAAAHDIGKASPAFQNYIQKVNKDNQPRHWLISYRFLIRKEFDKSLALVLASHHGTPPDIETLKALDTGGKDRPCGFKDHVYIAEQERLLALALDEAGIGLDEAKAIKLDKPRQVLLSGFLVLCDWIASGRAEGGEDHGLTEPWKSAGFRADETYGRLLGGNAPRPVQAAVADIFARANKPGLIIIEAPMGEGKTEAALAAAEAMAERSNRGGLFFALPTQATSNAMFSRVRDWLEKLKLQEPHTIDLVHGRKLANSEFKKMYGRGFATDGEPEDMLSVNSWTQNRKKALFSNFVVGTVDHLLMAALKQKHFMLRHLAIADKVVVIDEVHAYDAYMDVYLKRALNWLGAYRIPVVMLSATLTTAKRAELVNAYRNSEGPLELSAAYPIITYIDDGGEVVELPADASSRPLTVAVERLEGEPYDALEEVMAGGGCVGVIVNTVRRAQEIYAALKERGEKALLIHSRFKAGYRAELEERVKGLVGKGGERPERLVVVGTQVLEQSLDIDFDALFTDICPMDLLIQRIGRLHRHREHDASRPARLGAPRVFVMENDGSKRLYGEYLLSRTRELLPESLTLPQDIPRLVNAAYDGARAEGYDKHMEKVMDKESRAKHFRLAAPDRGKPSIAGILAMAASDSESAAAASVRDGQESIEVVIISEREWIDKGGRLTEDEVMERSARLPPFFSFGSYDKGVAAAVLELEKNHGDDSGNLYLAFDEDGVAELGGYRLRYSEETGLSYERV